MIKLLLILCNCVACQYRYAETSERYADFVWTASARRTALLAALAYAYGEPVLLVGETGVGKTTICQILAEMNAKRLNIVNCHMHTEAADFLGSMRPVRTAAAPPVTTGAESDAEAPRREKQLFEWRDGPLVDALKHGMDFLIDEISLADDSVLERLNSLLEEERTLLLAENIGSGGGGASTSDGSIKAHAAFRLVATMNPSGDFGKKELSAALRNRFTEIWCTQGGNGSDERRLICSHRLTIVDQRAKPVCVDTIDAFARWLPTQTFATNKHNTLSIRDLIAWIEFINVASSGHGQQQQQQQQGEQISDVRVHMHPIQALVHGACLVFVDSLSDESRRGACMRFLFDQIDASVKITG